MKENESRNGAFLRPRILPFTNSPKVGVFRRFAIYTKSLTQSNSVGLGDFYSFYWAKKRIDKSSFSATKKQSLVRLLQLIAQARHVSIAKEQFITGKRIKRTDVIVRGSENTFNRYLRDLSSLKINSMLIPKERKITHFTNPIGQLLT